MATAIFMRKEFDLFSEYLDKISGMTDEIAKKAMYEGARVYADGMKSELKGVLIDKNATQLVNAFGITPFKQNANFDYTTHLGFDGYQTLKNGKRVAFQLIARAINSGAFKDGKQIIKATHFAENAVRKNRTAAKKAMVDTVERLVKEQLGGI